MRNKLNNKKDYFQRHFELSKTQTQLEAWKALEIEWFEDNGRPLYTTFESFRKNKSIYYQNKANR